MMQQEREGHETSLAEDIARRVEKVFYSLADYPFFTPGDMEEFQSYRADILDALEGIGRKIVTGAIRPLDLKHFPPRAGTHSPSVRAALFIGSFDPFQMSHLVTALRFLASEASEADVVFTVPEGDYSALKPDRSDYGYRLDLMGRQLKEIFEPLLLPLDIGYGVGTMEIVNRFIRFFPGGRVRLTHLMGTDTLPFAAKFMAEDLVSWRAEAARLGTELEYRIFAARRDQKFEDQAQEARGILDGLKVRADIEFIPVPIPSSSDFRTAGAFTILFPTESVLAHLEVLFRYGFNRPWKKGEASQQEG